MNSTKAGSDGECRPLSAGNSAAFPSSGTSLSLPLPSAASAASTFPTASAASAGTSHRPRVSPAIEPKGHKSQSMSQSETLRGTSHRARAKTSTTPEEHRPHGAPVTEPEEHQSTTRRRDHDGEWRPQSASSSGAFPPPLSLFRQSQSQRSTSRQQNDGIKTANAGR